MIFDPLDAICRDDADQFFSMFSSPFTEIEPFYMYVICSEGAINCATALLEGETTLTVDINRPLLLVEERRYPLSVAAQSLHYELVDLFLRHGARTDIICEASVDDENDSSCPLKNVLDMLDYHLYLFDWDIEESIYKLVIILCWPQMKRYLEVVRLLACYTKDINEVFNYYAKEGKIIQMAVLLMVSKDLIMANKDGFNCQSIKEQMESLADSEKKLELLIGERERGKCFQMCKGTRATLMSKLSLLELFERAGDAIGSYLQSRQSKLSRETVVKDVARIFYKAGLVLEAKDNSLTYYIDSKSSEIVAVMESSGWANTGPFSDHKLLPKPFIYEFPKAKEKRLRKLRFRPLCMQFESKNMFNQPWYPALHTNLRANCLFTCCNNAFYKPLKAETKGITSATQWHLLVFKPSNLLASRAMI